MRKLQVFLVFLAIACLAACSGGKGQNPDGGASGNPPPPPPPAPPPPPPPPAQGTLACSPCTKLVFMSVVAGQEEAESEIYTINADGTELTRLTDNLVYDGEPAWSPDGQRIAFVSGRDVSGDTTGGSWRRDLYVMDADGSNVRGLTSSNSGARNPAWSPDGNRIVYEGNHDGYGGILEVPVDGGTPTLLFSTPGVDMQPAWAPDGTRLAVVSDWYAYDFVWDIFLVSPDGSGFSALTDGNIFDGRDYVEPAWSPDGSRLAFGVTWRGMFVEFPTQIGVMDANGSNLKLLPGTGGTSRSDHRSDHSVWGPTWSPDGTMIAYTDCDGGGCDIRWIKADGSEYGEIVRNAMHPDWQR